jgi:hypothetical protein
MRKQRKVISTTYNILHFPAHASKNNMSEKMGKDMHLICTTIDNAHQWFSIR